MAKHIAGMVATLSMDSRKFSAGARDATGKSRAMGREFDAAGKRANMFSSKLVQTGLKAVATFGTAELALGSVNAAAAAMSGNLQAAAEGIKSLPAGIGPFARQLETAIGTVSGLRAEIDGLTRSNAAMNIGIELQATNYAEAAKSARSFADMQRALNNETALSGMDSFNAHVEQARINAAEQVLQIERAIEDTRAAQRELSGKNVKDNIADGERLLAIHTRLNDLQNGIGYTVSRQLGTYTAEIQALQEEQRQLERNIALRRQRIDNIGVERTRLEGLAEQIKAAGEAAVKAAERADVTRVFDELNRKIAEFGATQAELDLRIVANAEDGRFLGAYEDRLADLRRLEEQQAAAAESARKLNEVLARGAATTERYMTSGQRFAQQFAELREEFALGAIGFKTFIRATADAARRARGPEQVNDPAVEAHGPRRGLVGAVTAGGAEDIRLRLAAGTGRPEAQREQVKEQRRTNRGIDRMTNEIIKMRLEAGVDVSL